MRGQNPDAKLIERLLGLHHNLCAIKTGERATQARAGILFKRTTLLQ